MTLQAGFTHPVADAQRAFRCILKAMSEPGTVVTLPFQPAWGDLSAAATAVILTLIDHDTPLWLDPALKNDSVVSNVRFHTGATLVPDTAAPFALISAASDIDVSQFFAGDSVAPEKSTTVIVDVAGLQEGVSVRLSGPGINTERIVAPQLPDILREYRCLNNTLFPAGIDLILTCGNALMALPRTTRVEVC